VSDYATPLLGKARHETWNVHQIDQRNIEGIAKTDKAGCLVRAVNIKTSCPAGRLICDHPCDHTVYATKPDNNVSGKITLNLDPLARVHDTLNNPVDIVCSLWIIRQKLIHPLIRIKTYGIRYVMGGIL